MQLPSVWIGIVIIMVMTASGGTIYGRLSNRWGAAQDQVEAGARLERIPSRFATWQSASSTKLPDFARNELACSGDIVRQYLDSKSGATIGVTLVVGPAGTIAVHSPEICFPSQNYRLLGKRRRVELQDTNGTKHTLWAVDFELQDVESNLVRVYYAWSRGGAWSAPDDPRFEFVGSPFLYKIQLVASLVAGSAPTNDPVPPFLREFLPEAGEGLLSAEVSH